MKRIQRKRTKGWKMPPNTVYVGRPSQWGNEYRVGDSGCNDVLYTAEVAVDLFKHYQAPLMDLQPLRGKNLACWCPVYECSFCHAKYGEEDIREGMRCFNNLSKPGSGAFRCGGTATRVQCHADVLLDLANK